MPRTATYRSQNEGDSMPIFPRIVELIMTTPGRVPISATGTLPRTYSLRPSVTRQQKDTRLSGLWWIPHTIRASPFCRFKGVPKGVSRSYKDDEYASDVDNRRQRHDRTE